ncbi:YqaA family protein, partial [Pseudomonas viridiflava]|uniref:YqaA family protein n=2 Tax=Pseudomonas TaxID=286 RepID=UPI0013D3D7CD
MFELSSYFGLFLAALGAATLLPMQSETVLAGMLLSQAYPAVVLLSVATAGNVLGSILNWLLGRSIIRLRHKRWFPASEAQLEKAQRFYLKYGYWSLLLSWVPLIGDPLTLIAGVLREPLWRFVLIVTVAKG